MAQERVQKQKAKTRTEESIAADTNSNATNAELAEKTDDTLASIDDVLEDQVDEELLSFMDDVLEEDAETFVANFINQGGE